MAAPAAAQTDGQPACAEHPRADTRLPNGYPFDAHRAVALFRFHRQQEALRELDAGRAIVRGPWRWRLPPDNRDEFMSELDELRNCLATAKPPALATLTVRVLGYAQDAAHNMAPRAGARVYVEGLPVGRTGRDGTLTARVPSGPIDVRAETPITEANWVDVTLAPGQSKSIEIGLSDGKEVSEHTTLVLAEASDDIVPAKTRSLTLRFMHDGRLAPVTRIDQIDVVTSEGDFRASIAEHFSVVGGELVANDAGRVFEVLAPQFDAPIVLQVQAMATGQAMHEGKIEFRVGQWPLSVTLEPPPSNRALPISKIEVGITLLGAGIAVQRVSDEKGRFEIESFPSGPIAFESVAISGGKYYYGDATLVHSGPRSVTLVLRNVEDVKNGVAPLRPGAPDANDNLPLGRAIEPPPAREQGIARILLESAPKDRTVAISTTLTVPRGAERLMLAYDIRTRERGRAPRFDDVWTLSVFREDGRYLLHMIRNTSSQERVHPHWQSDSRTGRIQEIFDISRHTAQGDVRLTLVGTVTNLGDDRYPTTVEALITAIDKGWQPSRRVF